MENIEILVQNKEDFNTEHIFECGQFFRYKKISENHYIAFSQDKKVEVFEKEEGFILKCAKEDKDYFQNFFDLNTDYSAIKNTLSTKYSLLQNAINFGRGIRILKQDILETIISFIISANNNIKRIQKSIEFICENAGEKRNGYYSFPRLEKLCLLDESFFVKAGLGYRAKYMVQAISQLQEINLEESKKLPTNKLKQLLESLSGVGPKVADCILLFSYSRKDVFPVDTWIRKVYVEDFKGKENNRKKIALALVEEFGELSGYAQQYLFYFKRSFKGWLIDCKNVNKKSRITPTFFIFYFRTLFF